MYSLILHVSQFLEPSIHIHHPHAHILHLLFEIQGTAFHLKQSLNLRRIPSKYLQITKQPKRQNNRISSLNLCWTIVGCTSKNLQKKNNGPSKPTSKIVQTSDTFGRDDPNLKLADVSGFLSSPTVSGTWCRGVSGTFEKFFEGKSEGANVETPFLPRGNFPPKKKHRRLALFSGKIFNHPTHLLIHKLFKA